MPVKLFVKLKNEILYESLDFDQHFAKEFVKKRL